MKRTLFLHTAIICLCTMGSFQSWSQWKKISNGRGSEKAIGSQIWSIIVTNNGTLLAGDVDRGIFISVNNGISWAAASQGLTNGKVNSFCLNGTYIFVATNSAGGVFRSSDDGKTWSKASNGLSQFAIIDLEVIASKIFALSNQGTIYFSNNDGVSWSQLTSAPSGANSISHSGTAILIGTPNGAWRSQDSGTTWSPISAVSSSRVIDIDSSKDLVVVSTTEGTYLSTDNGLTWNQKFLPRDYLSVAQIGSTIMLSFRFGNLWRSTNNGAAWTEILNCPKASKLVSKGSRFYASTVTGVYNSNDDGLTWSPSNLGLADLHPGLSSDGATIVHSDGEIVKTSHDWGETWVAQVVGNTAFVNSVFAKGGNIFLSKPAGGYISTSKGSTWASIQLLNSKANFGGSDGAVFASDNAYTYRSVDGFTWNTTTTLRLMHSFASNASKVFAGSMFKGDEFTGLFLSNDQGLAWKQVNYPPAQINALAYDGNTLVCATTSGVYKSIDDGVTWIQAGLYNVNVNSIIFYEGKILAAHREIEVSNDYGASWSTVTGEISLSLGLNDKITNLTKSGSRILVASSNGDIWISKCTDPQTPLVTGTWNHHPTILSSSSPVNNQWYIDSNKIIGAIEQKIDVKSSGSYTVKVTLDGCPSQMSLPYVITDCVVPPQPIISLSGQNPSFILTSSAREGNQWFLDGDPIYGAFSQVYLPKKKGRYTVQVTINGCKSNLSPPFDLNECFIPPTPTITLTGANPNFTLTSSSPMGNQWFLNDVPLEDGLEQIYKPSISGAYSVQVTLDGCKSNLSLFYPLIITGFSNNKVEEIEIFPNPFSNQLNILVGYPDSKQTIEVTIFSVSGKSLVNRVYPNVFDLSIDTSIIASGLYLVEINYNGSLSRYPVIKI